MAAKNIPVFPCGANKAPLTPNGFRDASTDPKKVRAFFTENPDALIGMPTGAASGLSVLDIDKKDGKQGLEWLKINEQRLPPTKSVKTRSGGVHLFFRHAAGLRSSAGSIANGVDIRGDAGYVIYWQAHGGRVLRNPEPAAFPTWLLVEALRNQNSASDGETAVERRLPPSAAAVVALLERLPNGPDVPRDVYIEVMSGASGCIAALRDKDLLADGDEERITEAAIAWAEKYTGNIETDERAKWQDDWMQRAGNKAGWQTLEKVAAKLIPGYATERTERQHAGVDFEPIEGVEEPDKPAPKLNHQAPMPAAREFLVRRFIVDQVKTLRHHAGNFHAWIGTRYRVMPDHEVEAQLHLFLEHALHCYWKGGKSHEVPYQPNKSRVMNVLASLQAVTLADTERSPSWLDKEKQPAADEILACANGLLHIPTRTLLRHTPAFFSPNALPYAYDPEAPTPAAWLAFLRGLWPEDQQTIDTLQEMFGLLLTSDTRHHKMFLLIGPPRSGKGTIGRVLADMLGRENCCNPTLSSLTQQFGLASLIGKPLATISDARLGRSVDGQTVSERLLSITGQDMQTIPRKYAEDWSGYLPTRFVIMSNELPRLTDASGALANRFIILQMRKSFLGKEDQGLTTRLLGELPGILNWSLSGLDRLKERGHFLQPKSAEEAVNEMADLASPINAFLRERCTIGSGHSVECGEMFAAWKMWCHAQNRDAVGTTASFSRDLRAAVPGLTTRQRREGGGGRQRDFEGVGLLSEEEAELADLL